MRPKSRPIFRVRKDRAGKWVAEPTILPGIWSHEFDTWQEALDYANFQSRKIMRMVPSLWETS